MTNYDHAYDWKLTLWKGVRSALLAGVSVAVLSFLNSLDMEMFVRLGIPSALAVGVIDAIRNYLKTR